MTPQQLNDTIKEQYGILLVTCPDCGNIIGIKDTTKDTYVCPVCGIEDDKCHFPDLFS